MTIQLTQDQQNAYAEIITLITTKRQYLVIEGGAGVGKTTLINTFLEEWPQLVALSGGTFDDIEVHLTATTNKAADALASATKHEVNTIHSFLGLRVVTEGYQKTKLISVSKDVPDGVLVIDESSFIDDELLAYILRKAKHMKIIFLGDPNQLKPVNSDTTPVFAQGWPTARLNQIVRQSDDSPIQALSRGLRSLVEGEPMPKAGVDGVNILHLPQADFETQFVQDALSMPVNGVRALSWTNKRAIYYNGLVALARNGVEDIHIGDIVNVNKQIALRHRYRYPTDSTFKVVALGQWEMDSEGIESRMVETHYGHTLRQARHQSALQQKLKEVYAVGQSVQAEYIENTYADLRLLYASTVNKAQGSTYDAVYIDLNDIGGCRDKDQVKRMLYVAASRARSKVVFTGDI